MFHSGLLYDIYFIYDNIPAGENCHPYWIFIIVMYQRPSSQVKPCMKVANKRTSCVLAPLWVYLDLHVTLPVLALDPALWGYIDTRNPDLHDIATAHIGLFVYGYCMGELATQHENSLQ